MRIEDSLWAPDGGNLVSLVSSTAVVEELLRVIPIPLTVNVVAHEVEPVDGRLQVDNIKALHVPITAGECESQPEAASRGFELLHECNKVGKVRGRAPSVAGTRIYRNTALETTSAALKKLNPTFPVNINAVKSLGAAERNNRVDKRVPVCRGRCHLGEGASS